MKRHAQDQVNLTQLISYHAVIKITYDKNGKKKIMIGILKDSVSEADSYDLPSKSYGEALSPIVPE